MTPSSATGLEAAGVSVRQLEWVQDANGQWIADTPIGRYIIQCPYRGSEHSVWLNGPNMVALQFPNAALNDVGWAHIEAPKAAAQRDYTARIMSALTVTSFPPAEQHDVTSHAVPHDGEGAVAWPTRRANVPYHGSETTRLVGFVIEKGDEAFGEYGLSEPLAWLDRMCDTHPAPVAAQPAEGIPLGYRYRSHYDGAWQHWPLTAWNSDVGAAYRERHPEAEPYFTEPEDALSALPAQPNSSEGEPTWDVEEFKVWRGIDASKPQWHGRGFACSSWTAANELAEYLLHNDASLVLRVAPIALATNPNSSEGEPR